MEELEGRLQTLTRLSPPTTEELGADVLHERATKVRRRSQLALAVPAAALVIVVLAAALALRASPATDETVPAGATDAVSSGAGLTPRDFELLDWIDTTATLRQRLMHEMLRSATYGSTDKSNPAELMAARASTNEALAVFESKTQQVQPEREGPETRDALKQVSNRVKALPTVRKSVDSIQVEATRMVDDYDAIITDLTTANRSLIITAATPDVLRGLLSASNLAAVTNEQARVAGLLTVAVEIRFYAAALPRGTDEKAARNNALGTGCGSDAAAAGDDCKLYVDVGRAVDRLGALDAGFEELADGPRKMAKRKADAGSIYDELQRHAIEDGQGRNDLTGAQPGTTEVAPADFRTAAAEQIDKLIVAEGELIGLIRTPNAGGPGSIVPAPTAPTAPTSGG